MGNVIYIGTFALIVLALAGVLDVIHVNNSLTDPTINENSVQTIDPNDNIKILNNQMLTESETCVVSGQAQNMGPYKMRYVSITVNFYDKNGNLLYSSFDAKSYVVSGEIWDFKVQYRKFTAPYSYKVEVGPTI